MKTDRQNERIVELNLSTGLQCITDVFFSLIIKRVVVSGDNI